MIMMCSAHCCIKAQTLDSLECEQYFDNLKRFQETYVSPPILWEVAPELKESNIPLINKLCEKLSENSQVEKMMATFILNENGNPICVEINSNVENGMLKNEIMSLLYTIEFQPAIAKGKPVRSHANIILGDVKCREYQVLEREYDKKQRRDKK